MTGSFRMRLWYTVLTRDIAIASRLFISSEPPKAAKDLSLDRV
jgi:hypothetical protein